MNDNQESIYFFQPDKPNVDTTTIFKFQNESGKLRVQSDKLNILFSKLDKASFDKWYNEFRTYLNINFSPVDLGDTIYVFTETEKTEIEQKLITSWLYHFTINNYKKILIRKSDFEHPYTSREIYHYLNEKFGKDSERTFQLGSHLLRLSLEEFTNTIDSYKQWAAMW